MAHTLTSLVPFDGVYAQHDSVISVASPDGAYEVIRFTYGQLLDGTTYWWGVRRQGSPFTEVLTTGLEEAMGWLARQLLDTCF